MSRWVFHDPVLSVNYTVDINPNTGGTPPFDKNMTYMSASGTGGSVIVFEGRDKVAETEISGVISTEAHLLAFQSWYEKDHQIRITDDLNRQYWIHITGLDLKRAQTRRALWRHTFRMRYLELDWP